MGAVEPNGCSACGVTARHHGRRYHPTVGQHSYTAPSDAQRLERMKARRAARSAYEVPEPVQQAVQALLEAFPHPTEEAS